MCVSGVSSHHQQSSDTRWGSYHSANSDAIHLQMASDPPPGDTIHFGKNIESVCLRVVFFYFSIFEQFALNHVILSALIKMKIICKKKLQSLAIGGKFQPASFNKL